MKRARSYPAHVLNAAQLLGAQVRQGRIERRWTVAELAERAGVSRATLLKVEHGDPTVALGTAFDVAGLVGVSLFYDDEQRLAKEAAREVERATLMGKRVRSKKDEIDYEF